MGCIHQLIHVGCIHQLSLINAKGPVWRHVEAYAGPYVGAPHVHPWLKDMWRAELLPLESLEINSLELGVGGQLVGA